MSNPRFTLSLIALLTSLVGCASVETAGVPSESLRAASGRDYLIDELRIEPLSEAATGFDASAGFDLDSLDSGRGSDELMATCEEFQPDFVSTFDGVRTGADNALMQLIPIIEALTGRPLQQDLIGATGGGRSRLVIRIESVPEDADAYDPAVELWLVDADQPIAVEDGGIVAGQALRGRRLVSVAAGSHGTRLIARDVGLAGDALGLDPVATLDFDAFRLGAIGVRATEPGVAQRTLVGQLGGSFDLRASVDRTVVLANDGGATESTIHAVLQGVADIEPGADVELCTRISAGFTFSATEVELVD